MNPFADKIIRSVHDKTNQKYWFSTVDMCAVLTGNNHENARKYWKWLKHKLTQEGHQLVSVTNQLKFLAPDGKFYFTEAMDITNLLYLIQLCPSSKANPYRLWLVDMFMDAKAVEAQLASLGEESAKIIAENFKNRDYVLQTTTREEIPL